MLQIRYKPSFVREYRRLPEALRAEVREKIALFEEDPDHPSLKLHKLKGRLRGFSSFSVNYRYRIVCEWEGNRVVRLLIVGDHSVYD